MDEALEFFCDYNVDHYKQRNCVCVYNYIICNVMLKIF